VPYLSGSPTVDIGSLKTQLSGSGNKESSELCGANYFCSLKFRKGKVFLVASD
jgi:hypothetical protein